MTGNANWLSSVGGQREADAARTIDTQKRLMHSVNNRVPSSVANKKTEPHSVYAAHTECIPDAATP